MANKYKTLPIGTIFTYNGNKYKVCEDNSCDYICNQCAFNGITCDGIKCIRGNCTISSRTDNIQVYYKQINETMKKDSGNAVCPTFNTNNSLNDLHVECPKGYSIDVEHSDLSKGIIKFKKDDITLEDIYKDKTSIQFASNNIYADSTNPYCNKLSAIAALMDIANYYNKGWKPNWNNSEELKYHIVFDFYYNIYRVKDWTKMSNNIIYFAHEGDAKSVIDNPNFRDILDTIYKD